MLVFTRRPCQKIDITLEDGRRIEVVVLSVLGHNVRCGVKAPGSILVDRHEVTERKEAEARDEQI
jgi:carbon storage regulator CsrA